MQVRLMMAAPVVVEMESEEFKLPDFVSVEYIGRDKGQVRLAYDGECIQFEWCPTNVAATALRAVEAYYKHCEKLLAKHLESSTPPTPPQGPDYSKVEGGKHYWILASNKAGFAKWFVAKYLLGDGGYWVSLEDNEQIKLPRVFKIGERVPHPEDK